MKDDDKSTNESRRNLITRLLQEPPSPENDSLLNETIGDRLAQMGVSRRGFMQFCAGMASMMAIPAAMVPRMAAAALAAKPSVIYMSFQECTGCLESLVNSSIQSSANSTTIENLILNLVSLDYQETLMTSAGHEAETIRDEIMAANNGSFVLIVDGSIPKDPTNGYFISGGKSGVTRFVEAANQAGLILAVGTCAAFGGLPNADPNPTGAVSIGELMASKGINKPLINISGCPPIAEVITGVIMYYLTYGAAPALDSLKRPRVFYGEDIHDECYRKDYFEKGLFANTFDDAGARQGYCLLKLGCKGPISNNACSEVKWNARTSFPMKSGHGCMGCSQPYFWDGGVTTAKANPVPFWKNGPYKSPSFYSPLPASLVDD
jgi:hydrogenase small subunit